MKGLLRTIIVFLSVGGPIFGGLSACFGFWPVANYIGLLFLVIGMVLGFVVAAYVLTVGFVFLVDWVGDGYKLDKAVREAKKLQTEIEAGQISLTLPAGGEVSMTKEDS